MPFVLKPVLAMMKDFYELPRDTKRFEKYLSLMQGQVGADISLPIHGYNPMGKNHILERISELEKLEAEQVCQDELDRLNSNGGPSLKEKICVVINLADDLQGLWTDRFATDFEAKFKCNAILERNFCTPFLWSSESYTERLIRQRTEEAALRAIYGKKNGRLRTLQEFVKQEVFVARHSIYIETPDSVKFEAQVQRIYDTFKEKDEYTIIFNFFYGDEASRSLGYPTYGIIDLTGFEFVRSKMYTFS